MTSTHQIRLAIIDGSPELNSRFQAHGIEPVSIPVTERVISAIVEARPDAVLLMKSIGARTAIWICRAIKERHVVHNVPVIFYGFGDDPAVENAAFAVGADDYVARSVTAGLMSARISAILRRFELHRRSDDVEENHAIRIGEIEVKFESYLASVQGRTIPLTVGEFRVLWKLARNIGKTMSASELSPVDQNLDGPPPDRSVRSHVWSLRRKLGRIAGAQIKTVRNAGYRLNP